MEKYPTKTNANQASGFVPGAAKADDSTALGGSVASCNKVTEQRGDLPSTRIDTTQGDGGGGLMAGDQKTPEQRVAVTTTTTTTAAKRADTVQAASNQVEVLQQYSNFLASARADVEAADKRVDAARADVDAARADVDAARADVEAANNEVRLATQQLLAAEDLAMESQNAGDVARHARAQRGFVEAEDYLRNTKKQREMSSSRLEHASSRLEHASSRLEHASSQQKEAASQQKKAASHLEALRGESNATIQLDSDSFNMFARATRARFDTIDDQICNPWALGCKTALFSRDRSDAIPRVEKLRHQIAAYHKCAKTTGMKDSDGKKVTLAQCCVTRIIGDHNAVIAAHLLPRSAPRKMLDFLDMDKIQGFDNYRNLVLLVKNIETAFDCQRLCFEKRDDGMLYMEFLDPTVQNEFIYPGSLQRIEEFAEFPMLFSKGKKPYSRVLSLHRMKSYEVAIKKGWIPAAIPVNYGSPVTEISIHQMESCDLSSVGCSTRCGVQVPASTAEGDQRGRVNAQGADGDQRGYLTSSPCCVIQ